MKLRALLAIVALLMAPMAFAAKPGEVEPVEVPMEVLLQPVAPLALGQQVLGTFVIEGFEDGTMSVAAVKVPDIYFPEGTLGAAAKAVIIADPYISIDGLSYTECYQDGTFLQRCDWTPGSTGTRYIRIQNMLYNHPTDCDYIYSNPVATLVSASNCNLVGSGVSDGGTIDACGNTVHDVDDPDPGRDGRFDVYVVVNVPSPARFTIYVNLVGEVKTDTTCIDCTGPQK